MIKQILCSTSQQVEGILQRMSFMYDPTKSKTSVGFGTTKKLCHLNTVNKVKERNEGSDIIWLYGDGDRVYHSCLSDAHNNILVGARYTADSAAHNKFLGDAGFKISDDFGTLELMRKTTVAKWLQDYFK